MAVRRTEVQWTSPLCPNQPRKCRHGISRPTTCRMASTFMRLQAVLFRVIWYCNTVCVSASIAHLHVNIGCCTRCAQEHWMPLYRMSLTTSLELYWTPIMKSLIVPLPGLELLLRDRFRLVQGHISSLISDSVTNKLFVMFDEAQTLSDRGRDCFVSRADPRDL